MDFGGLVRAWDRTASVVTRDADLRQWRDSFSDATPIIDLVARQPGCAVGVVSRITLVPGKHLQVLVEDGSGSLAATFTNRTTLPGLELGAALHLGGCVAEQPDGNKHMLNPAWRPVAEPYAESRS